MTAAQLVQPALHPSNLTLPGLVRHMTEVERSWFRRRFADEDIARLHTVLRRCLLTSPARGPLAHRPQGSAPHVGERGLASVKRRIGHGQLCPVTPEAAGPTVPHRTQVRSNAI
ncbi:DUF664 domain-containing protein [Streptomyces longispororuber]|uniref:mycothiol transferase n=1 Tax=Streptomyces longispororuber TaxID=68230 RepID=UPI0037030E45